VSSQVQVLSTPSSRALASQLTLLNRDRELDVAPFVLLEVFGIVERDREGLLG